MTPKQLATLGLALALCAILAPCAEAQTKTQSATFNITWSDNSGNDPKINDQEDGFNIKRSTSQAGPFVEVAKVGPNITTYSDIILNDNGVNQYCYTVSAFNATGTSPDAIGACATTPKIDTGPLTPVIKSVTVTVTINLQ